MMRHKSHLPLLRQGCYQQNPFHPRKAFSDTTSRPATKREVGKLWPRFTLRCGPAFRIERKRVFVISPIAMHYILTHHYERLPSNSISTNLAINSRQSADGPGWWVEPH